MTDYTELVKALRLCASQTCCDNCPRFDNGLEPYECTEKLYTEAAAAIDELQKTLKAVQKNSGINFRMWEEAQAEVKRLQDKIDALQAEVKAKESSKQRWRRLAMDTADYVDVVRCGDCQWYDPLDKSRPFFCPVMDCVNGVMEDDYCSRGERRAKVEVQDGSKD